MTTFDKVCRLVGFLVIIGSALFIIVMAVTVFLVGVIDLMGKL